MLKNYSNELKLQIVKEYLSGSLGRKVIAEKYGVSPSDIQKWADVYKKHSAEGLCVINGTYTGEFKISVVEYMHDTSSSARQTAVFFNIPSYTTVCQWERIYIEEGKAGLLVERRGRGGRMRSEKGKEKFKENSPAKDDLIAEVQRLRMENEYLKKLNALIQSRERSKNPTK